MLLVPRIDSVVNRIHVKQTDISRRYSNRGISRVAAELVQVAYKTVTEPHTFCDVVPEAIVVLVFIVVAARAVNILA